MKKYLFYSFTTSVIFCLLFPYLNIYLGYIFIDLTFFTSKELIVDKVYYTLVIVILLNLGISCVMSVKFTDDLRQKLKEVFVGFIIGTILPIATMIILEKCTNINIIREIKTEITQNTNYIYTYTTIPFYSKNKLALIYDILIFVLMFAYLNMNITVAHIITSKNTCKFIKIGIFICIFAVLAIVKIII